ncbi:MAG: hypothetical protein KGL26_07920 [Pseudomonadota bacterium]|nr:hypothetical protein [Pseudomonadota bacterium]
MQAFMMAVLLGGRLDALDSAAEPEPSHGSPEKVEEGIGAGDSDRASVGPHVRVIVMHRLADTSSMSQIVGGRQH